jgi:hypothetical protein
MKPKNYVDNLSRFRDDVLEFSKKFGGVVAKKKSKPKIPLTRRQKRKLERKFKNAKKLAFSKREKVHAPISIFMFIEQTSFTQQDHFNHYQIDANTGEFN